MPHHPPNPTSYPSAQTHTPKPRNTRPPDIDLGAGTRPFRSGGGAGAGPNSASYQTFWNLKAAQPLQLPDSSFGPQLNFVGAWPAGVFVRASGCGACMHAYVCVSVCGVGRASGARKTGARAHSDARPGPGHPLAHRPARACRAPAGVQTRDSASARVAVRWMQDWAQFPKNLWDSMRRRRLGW